MKEYLADANIFLRYLLRDNIEQVIEIKKYFSGAEKGKLSIKVLSEIIPEVEYVLRKVYRIPRYEIGNKLLQIIKINYLDIEKRGEWLEALEYYLTFSVDLVDALLFTQAKRNNLVILSFDKDYKKIKTS